MDKHRHADADGHDWWHSHEQGSAPAHERVFHPHVHLWSKEYAPHYRAVSEAEDFRWVCSGCTETHGMKWSPGEPKRSRTAAGQAALEKITRWLPEDSEDWHYGHYEKWRDATDAILAIEAEAASLSQPTVDIRAVSERIVMNKAMCLCGDGGVEHD